MADAPGGSGHGVDFYDIEAAETVAKTSLPQILRSGQDDLFPLVCVDGLRRRAEEAALPRLDLDEDERLPVLPGDDVDFAHLGAVVARGDAVSLAFEESRRAFLAALSQFLTAHDFFSCWRSPRARSMR